MTYNWAPLQSSLDPSIATINDMAARITRSAYPGAHLVEFFKFLQYVPASMAKWKREADEWYHKYSKMFEKYYGEIEELVVRYGSPFPVLCMIVTSCVQVSGEEQPPSFCATLAETKSRHGLSKLESSWLAATM